MSHPFVLELLDQKQRVITAEEEATYPSALRAFLQGVRKKIHGAYFVTSQYRRRVHLCVTGHPVSLGLLYFSHSSSRADITYCIEAHVRISQRGSAYTKESVNLASAVKNAATFLTVRDYHRLVTAETSVLRIAVHGAVGRGQDAVNSVANQLLGRDKALREELAQMYAEGFEFKNSDLNTRVKEFFAEYRRVNNVAQEMSSDYSAVMPLMLSDGTIERVAVVPVTRGHGNVVTTGDPELVKVYAIEDAPSYISAAVAMLDALPLGEYHVTFGVKAHSGLYFVERRYEE